MNSENSGEEVVYGHRMKDETKYFHIGSGSEERSMIIEGRSNSWRSYVDDHGGEKNIVIKILERHRCPARARLREMELVKKYQPFTNTFGRKSVPAGILDGRPKGKKTRCSCGAPDCYGAEVVAMRR